nr:retrovirus-related Pol polyprotein from transposon TNT 1-94 [Tanacetum cinerariifolium]
MLKEFCHEIPFESPFEVVLTKSNYFKEEGHWKFSCPKLKEKGQVAAVAKDESSLERDVVLSVVDYKGMLDSKGLKYTSENGVLRVSNRALVVMKSNKGTSSLYTLQGETITGSAFISCSDKSDSDLTMLWHMRLGHMSEKGIVIWSKQGLLDNHKVSSLEFCEHCVIEKQNRVSFSKLIHQTKVTPDYLHSDCRGPSRVTSHGVSRYFLSIIDDFSRMTWVFMMKHKREAFKKLSIGRF